MLHSIKSIEDEHIHRQIECAQLKVRLLPFVHFASTSLLNMNCFPFSCLDLKLEYSRLVLIQERIKILNFVM